MSAFAPPSLQCLGCGGAWDKEECQFLPADAPDGAWARFCPDCGDHCVSFHRWGRTPHQIARGVASVTLGVLQFLFMLEPVPLLDQELSICDRISLQVEQYCIRMALDEGRAIIFPNRQFPEVWK